MSTEKDGYKAYNNSQLLEEYNKMVLAEDHLKDIQIEMLNRYMEKYIDEEGNGIAPSGLMDITTGKIGLLRFGVGKWKE